MPRRLLHVLVVLGVATAGTTAVAAPRSHVGVLRRGGVTATVGATSASLGNSRISREWSIDAGSVTTVALTDASRHDWASAGPDFRLDVDGVTTTSAQGWSLESVQAEPPPELPGRPASASGAALLFRYVPVTAALPSGVELDRLVVLHDDAGVFETRTTLVDGAPAPLRVSSYSLDQISSDDPTLPVEVQAYNEGSDWRDDYRHVSTPTGSFDAEGEVVRFGTSAGVFLVSQRRGGAMSRAGRTSDGAMWIGVDWARDLFDWGPLQDAPPSYNRLENPAYPAPIRARLVAPLGSLDLGTSFVGVYSGGAQQAAATFTSDFARAVAPAYPRTVGMNTFHPWGHGPGMSDANLRTQVDLAASMGVETFMLDDQWQGGPGGESGDWNFDPARFPDADGNHVPDFVDYVHARGLQLGLWMSPLEFNGASQTYAAHPDWACAPVGDVTAQVPDDAGLGVWDATNPQFQDYLVGVIERLVHDYDVREFKFDFTTWVDCPPHDYADYEDAFVSLVRRMQAEMQAEHHDVTFEIDETNDQRAWPFESAALGPSWFDNGHLHGSTPVAKLLHDVWSASPWVPTWSLGVGALDGTLSPDGPYTGPAGVDALMPLALLTHTTFWTNLTALSPDERAEVARWTSWFAAHRDQLGSVVYELTTDDPLDGASWAAWQPWNGAGGFVFAFRQSGGGDTRTLRVQGVDPSRVYDVTLAPSGAAVGQYTGAQLADGLDVTLPPYGAEVLQVTPV